MCCCCGFFYLVYKCSVFTASSPVRRSMSHISEIAQWCRDNYSPDGLEVASQGVRSLTLKVPADLPLTEICAELWNRFGATLELRQSATSGSATIVVWQSGNASQHEPSDQPLRAAVSPVAQGIPQPLLSLCIFALLVALFAPMPKLHGNTSMPNTVEDAVSYVRSIFGRFIT